MDGCRPRANGSLREMNRPPLLDGALTGVGVGAERGDVYEAGNTPGGTLRTRMAHQRAGVEEVLLAVPAVCVSHRWSSSAIVDPWDPCRSRLHQQRPPAPRRSQWRGLWPCHSRRSVGATEGMSPIKSAGPDIVVAQSPNGRTESAGTRPVSQPRRSARRRRRRITPAIASRMRARYGRSCHAEAPRLPVGRGEHRLGGDREGGGGNVSQPGTGNGECHTVCSRSLILE